MGYVSTDKTLKGFQLSTRGRLDLAPTTNTVNHIRAVLQNAQKMENLRSFVGTKKEPNTSTASIFPTTQGATFTSLEETEREVGVFMAH